MTDYGDLVRALNDVDAAHAAASAAAMRGYTVGHAAGSAEIANAESVARTAEEARHAVAGKVDAVDERARGLWSELRALLGWRGRWLGDVPEPFYDSGLDVAPSGPAAAPSELLDRAAGTIARSALGEQIAPIPRGILPLLPVFGAIAGLVVGLPIRGVLALTGERVFGVNLVAEILIFFAPFAGVPLLAVWTRHRYGARPDIGSAALTALGGMISSCALVLLLR